MEKSLTTGLWLIFHPYYSNLALTHSVVMGGKRWILSAPLFKMVNSPNQANVNGDIAVCKFVQRLSKKAFFSY